LLGEFPVDFYTDPALPSDFEADLLFGDSLALLAFRAYQLDEIRQCDQVYVRTWWLTVMQPPDDYHITLVLADNTGNGRARSDSPLAYDLTSHWSPGQDVLDKRFIEIPCDLPIGRYDLLVGLYPLETVQNLLITYPDGTPYGQLAYLTNIEVKEAESEQ
jgi:hypothetical protein